jgi:hypothetical protein
MLMMLMLMEIVCRLKSAKRQLTDAVCPDDKSLSKAGKGAKSRLSKQLKYLRKELKAATERKMEVSGGLSNKFSLFISRRNWSVNRLFGIS